jgi:hypothetical protein
VRTGSINDHNDEFVRVRLADLHQEVVHVFGIPLRGDLPILFPLCRSNRTIDIGELPFVTVVHRRTHWRWRSKAVDSHRLSEARLVLEHDPRRSDPYIFRRHRGRHVFREFVFHSS